MTRVFLFDLARTLLFPKDRTYLGDLAPLHAERSQASGYKFFDYFEFNTEVLDFLKTLTSKYTLCLFTAGTIQEHPEAKVVLESLFSKMFSSVALGMRKTDPAAFQYICSQLQVSPTEVVYIDDNPACLEAAAASGLTVIRYTTNSELIGHLQSYL